MPLRVALRIVIKVVTPSRELISEEETTVHEVGFPDAAVMPCSGLRGSAVL